MRSLLLFTLALMFATATQAQEGLAGTWSVTLTETGVGTCQAKKGAVTAQVWIVSTQEDGTVVVDVQGTTPFKKLGGRIDNGELVLQAYKGKTDATWIKLRIEGDQLYGLRRHLSVQRQQFLKSKATAPCFLDLDVTGKKTG